MTTLKAGDTAPPFSALATSGNTISLSDYAGRKLVLYFYPMDDTPGCTKQACSLRDFNKEITAKGAAILGISTQDMDSHRRFTKKFNLDFPLLADTSKKICKDYGVIGISGPIALAKNIIGFADRVTFIIDAAGKIVAVIDSPDTANHGAEVLRYL